MYQQLNFTDCPEDPIANDVISKPMLGQSKKRKLRCHRKYIIITMELINLIKLELNDPSHQILDMNKVNIP